MELQNSQLKSQKEKKIEDKNRNKSNGKKQNIVLNMVGYLPCSIIPASTNDLNTLIDKDCQSGSKNVSELYVVYKKPNLNIKHMQIKSKQREKNIPN